jgi:hypothetical protein
MSKFKQLVMLFTCNEDRCSLNLILDTQLRLFSVPPGKSYDNTSD